MKPFALIPRSRRAIAVIAVAGGCFLVLSLFGAGAIGQQPASDQAGDRAGSGVAGMTAKTLGSVAIVLGLLYGAMYAVKVLSRRQGWGGAKSEAVSVLHRTHIAPNKSIYVIKVGKKAKVVGVTDVQISHLADLTEEDVAGIKPQEPVKPFKDHLLALGFGRTRK
jgi:flagellar biosynthetic protein FliO